ncbi:unnamed protein product [Ectocarpus sp. CCAP 1310/34]|nr:unnamed protein product [Ectocarpus sp. CCAP 1310/34]
MPRHHPQNRACAAAATGTLAALCVSFVLGASIGWWLGGRRSRQEAALPETWLRGNKPSVIVHDAGESFVRHYKSFAAYAAEMLNSTEPLPVSVITPNDGHRAPMSLPLGTIIGVQVNLRRRDGSSTFVTTGRELLLDFGI